MSYFYSTRSDLIFLVSKYFYFYFLSDWAIHVETSMVTTGNQYELKKFSQGKRQANVDNTVSLNIPPHCSKTSTTKLFLLYRTAWHVDKKTGEKLPFLKTTPTSFPGVIDLVKAFLLLYNPWYWLIKMSPYMAHFK